MHPFIQSFIQSSIAPIHLPNHPSIHPPTNPSIYQSIHKKTINNTKLPTNRAYGRLSDAIGLLTTNAHIQQTMHPMHPSIHPSIHPSNQPTNQSVSQSVSQSVNQSINTIQYNTIQIKFMTRIVSHQVNSN